MCRRVCVLEQGQLNFDGDLEDGLAFYERMLASRVEHDETMRAVTRGPEAATSAADLARAPHRTVARGHWYEAGLWLFEYLRCQGLEPHHYVLDVGCGSLSAGIHLLPFLDDGHYYGLEGNGALLGAGVSIELPHAGIDQSRGHFIASDRFDLSEIRQPLDFAFANSLFASMSFNSVARCISSVVCKLGPSGRFYATWFENPNPGSFEPLVQSGGTTTYPDHEPYHYPFALIANVCDAIGASVERIPESKHPRGESVLLIRRRHNRDEPESSGTPSSGDAN
jgi:SAM-dependent methyltransferase